MHLHPATLDFLTTIKEENSRTFFASIKDLYHEIFGQFETSIDHIIKTLVPSHPHFAGVTGKSCLFRIYRDARRLEPGDLIYKENFWAYITDTGKKSQKSWYYLHIQPGGSFFASGLYWCQGKPLHNLRTYLAEHGKQYQSITQDSDFTDRFWSVTGESLKTHPKGFNADTPYLDIIKHKQRLVYRHYSDAQVLAPGFLDTVVQDCLEAQPFSELLNRGLEWEWDK